MNVIASCFYELFVNQFPKVVISQTILYGIAMVIKNPTLVDVAWGFNHALIGLGIASQSFSNFSNVLKLPNLIGMGLLTIWMLRLSGFIFYHRIYKPHVDQRYVEMAEQRKMNKLLYYFVQFQGQGLLLSLTSVPLYFVFAMQRSLSLTNYFGALICLIGIIGEAIADNQMQKFKESRTDPKELYRGGLFKNARHPNLFFDIVFWTGISIFAFNPKNLVSLFAFFGPMTLWAIMNFLTIPITTKHMKKSRPDYDKVIESTNKFIPL